MSRYVSARALLADTIAGEPVEMPGVTVANWDGKDAEGLIGSCSTCRAAPSPEQGSSSRSASRPFSTSTGRSCRSSIPRIVLFARNGETLVGFLFGMPDRLECEAAGGDPEDLCERAARRRASAGRHLSPPRASTWVSADVIHALMHEDNVSRERSEKHKATVFRRYALMARRLT